MSTENAIERVKCLIIGSGPSSTKTDRGICKYGDRCKDKEQGEENEKGETGYGRKTRRNNRTGYRSAGDL